MVALDLTGKRFGKWLVLEKLPSENKGSKFRCICDCGNIKVIMGSELNIGRTKSCGCVHPRLKTKMYRDHPLYDVWKGMKARCRSPKHRGHKNYHDKGVKVCHEWDSDFKSFYDWAISNGYKEGLQIDKDIKAKEMRLEPNLYSPERCQFVTAARNSHAKEGLKLNMEMANEIRSSNLRRKDISKKYKINVSTVDRIKNNKIWKNQ